MYRRFRSPAIQSQRLAFFRRSRTLSFWFGVLVVAALVITPVLGRFVIPAKFYRNPFETYRSDVWFRPPSLFRADAADSSLTSANSLLPRTGRIVDEAGDKPIDHYVVADWNNLPLKGAILGTTQCGANVMWRLIHGSEVVVIHGVLSAMLGLTAGLLWGLAMSWWSPPLFPGHHKVVTGWRWGIGRLAGSLFELLDLFPRIILLLFVSTIGGITLGRFCLAVGLLIALQVAAGVRQHSNELRRSDTVASAEELGLSPARIVWGHIVWNHLQGFVLSQYAFALGAFVLWDATLGYLGYTEPGHNSWGQIIQEGMRHMIPWMTWAASIVTVLAVLGLFRLSDGIERWKTRE
jgi:peptide/nickel transport system permease protein